MLHGSRGFIGSVFMIAGCAMGAGSLAIPMLAAGPNFIFSTIALIVSGSISYLVARTSLEMFLLYKNEVNVSTIAGKNFGYPGVVLFGIINMSLMYTLLSVYMSGGADLLDKTILPGIGLNVPSKVSLLIFLIIVIPIFFKGALAIVKSNSVIFAIKLVSFATVVLAGIAFVTPNLSMFVISQAQYIPKAYPIFFTALWFHFMIPVIAKLNNYDRERCKKIFAVGLILPVILYILWVGVILSLVPRDGDGNTFFKLLSNKESVGTMISYAMYNNPNIPNIMKFSLNIFSNMAMLTSFLTVGISTYDYLRDAFQIVQTKRGIINNLILTMLPPAFFALFFPNGFVVILQQAAILLMLTNLVVLACCIKEYKSLEKRPSKILIWSLACILILFISFQVLDNMNILPSFGTEVSHQFS
jgi:amino acid permease